MQDPNINFRKITRHTVDILHMVVILLLPVIWLGDYKNLISLIFKTIRSKEPHSVEISYSLYIIINILGLCGFIVHRWYRLKEHGYRYDALKRENSFVDTYDQQEVKIKLLKKINELVEMRNNEWELTHEIYKTTIEHNIPVSLEPSESGKKSHDGHTTDSSMRQRMTAEINTNSPTAKQKRRHWNAQGIFRKSFSDAEASKRRREQV